MGNVGAISVHANQESISSPGEQSAISDPIGPDLVDDPHEFFAELIEVSKDPINYLANEHYLVKELRIEGPNPDEFTCSIILDGKKLQALIPQWKKDDEDVCRSRFDVFADRKKLFISSTEWNVEKEGVKGLTMNSKFHIDEKENTMRVEIWAITAEGERKAGKFIAGVAEWLWVKPLLACRFGQKVKVRSNIECCDTGGRSSLSEPLDAYYTAQEFYEALINLLKQTCTDLKGEISYKSDNEFQADWSHEFDLPKEWVKEEGGEAKGKLTLRRSSFLDPAGLQIVTHDYINDEMTMNSFYKVHSDPVRWEFWQILPSGVRRGGGRQAVDMRWMLMKLVSEAEVTEELTSLVTGGNSYMF